MPAPDGGGAVVVCQWREFPYTGTLASLAHLYELDPDSPVARMKWNSRASTLQTLRVVVSTVGDRRVDMITSHDVIRWHRKWGEPAKGSDKPRPYRARGAIDRLRQIVSFGVMLGFRDCGHLARILAKLRFDMPPARAAA